MRYSCMPNPVLELSPFAIEAVQPDHIEAIRRWRNSQMDVLRQSAPISPEGQVRYYEQHIWPTMGLPQPQNILVSYLEDGRHIGYGGLVHIDWVGRSAEVSFLLDPALTTDEAVYRRYHVSFLALVKMLAFDDLGMEHLTTETHAHRGAHIANLEAAGFRWKSVIPNKVLVTGVATDSIMHRCCREPRG